MADRPSDRAISQALYEQFAAFPYPAGWLTIQRTIEHRAREIDAATQDGAQGPVGEVIVYDSYRGAKLYDAEDCRLPEGAKLYLNPSQDAEDAARYRWLLSQARIGAVQTQLPLYMSPHIIIYEECDDAGNIEAAIDAARAAEKGVG